MDYQASYLVQIFVFVAFTKYMRIRQYCNNIRHILNYIERYRVNTDYMLFKNTEILYKPVRTYDWLQVREGENTFTVCPEMARRIEPSIRIINWNCQSVRQAGRS